MEHTIDNELKGICREIQRDNRTVNQWAEIEACDWFQTEHYCGGFDATEMQFLFSFTVSDIEHCFALTLEQALGIAKGEIVTISLDPSPWD